MFKYIAATFLLLFVISEAAWLVNAAPETNAATYIGTVDGKFFFVDNTTGTWSSASSTCTAGNMKLASLNSTAQVALIKASSGKDYVNNAYYWIAAQEINTAARFAWSTSQTVVDPLSIPLSTKPPVTYCLAFYSGTSTATASFSSVSCTTSSYRALCEIS